MKKKILNKILLAIIVFTMSKSVLANDFIKLWIDGEYVISDINPILVNNRTLVPIRLISEKLGYTVGWISSTNEIQITNDETLIRLKVSSNEYFINGEKVITDVPPVIINERTFVPVRLVAESFNKVVDWDNQRRTVVIGSGYEEDIEEDIYEKVKVKRVVDGDTIEVILNGEEKTVRLIGVNTPETKHPKKGVEFYGKEASAFTKSSLEGKTVYLEKDKSDTDKYGRLLRFVWIKKPTHNPPTSQEVENDMFNAILVKDGYAKAMAYGKDLGYQENFQKLQDDAVSKTLGLWQDKENIESLNKNNEKESSEQNKIKGNKNSKVYHLKGQQGYDKISDENVVYFDTEQDAINAGYRKAKK